MSNRLTVHKSKKGVTLELQVRRKKKKKKKKKKKHEKNTGQLFFSLLMPHIKFKDAKCVERMNGRTNSRAIYSSVKHN